MGCACPFSTGTFYTALRGRGLSKGAAGRGAIFYWRLFYEKKALAVFLALSLCVCLLSGVSFATGDGTPDASAPETGTPEPDGVTVNMTVSAAGELVLVNQPVAVTDVDGDGALTVRDALTIAHDTYYEAPSDEDGAKPEESDTSGDAQTPGDGEDAETPEDGENAEKITALWCPARASLQSFGGWKTAAATATMSITSRPQVLPTRLRTATTSRPTRSPTWKLGPTCIRTLNPLKPRASRAPNLRSSLRRGL